MSDRPASSHPVRRDLIKAGILAGMSAVLPWHRARADLQQVARDRTMILDTTCRIARDPDREMRLLWSRVAAGSS